MVFRRCPTLRQCTTALSVAVALALAFWPTFSTAADGKYERAVSGNWKLTAALDGAHITSLDENEALQLVGRVFTIRKESVKFGSRVCGPSDFEAERVEPKIYLPEQFHARAEKLGLPSPVTAVDLSCTTVFIKSPNRLVIFWEGWFFDAVRVKR
ncbi:hypothetical protein [Massilia horti]|uniref:Uncharacterized protein n=1 Tax=Massilia horti TaxID=2562153 RepID=A0A4Y9SS51_9BURK|nr:hypothetical protein [Massilia horti]TFW28024.1 hypothetical protein E4O92_22450 [Massilia horti]